MKYGYELAIMDSIGTGDALVVVDVQNDFCPGGSLAVTNGDRVVDQINELIEIFGSSSLLIVKTRDWHPRKTKHFAEFGGDWPAHCVQNTKGAEFHIKMIVDPNEIIVSKGLGDENNYSGFDGVDDLGFSLKEILEQHCIKRLFIVGLATDYCVKQTVLDALQYGYPVVVPSEGIKAVNLNSEDGEKAVNQMREAGAIFI